MKALFFDPTDEGKTIHAEPIPEDLAVEAQACASMFDALTHHDEQDRITTAYLEGQDIAPRNDPRPHPRADAEARRSSRCCAAPAASTSASSRCSTP